MFKGKKGFREIEERVETEAKIAFYLLDCATRSISLRLAMPALLMSLFAAKISSSASVSWMLRGLFMLAALAPSLMWRMARSILRCGATSTDRW